jgi:SAM-dependent methyltransferase
MWQLTPVFYDLLQYIVHGDYSVLGATILKAYDRHRPAKAIELGCGTGLLSRFFAGDEYTGVDTDAVRIELARRHHPEHEFVVGDATDLGAEYLARFTFIFCHGWIHHLDDAQVRRLIDQIRVAAVRSGHLIELLVLEPLMPNQPWLNPLGYGIAQADRGGRVRTQRAMVELLGPSVYKTVSSKLLWYWPIPGAAFYVRFEGHTEGPKLGI